MAFHLDKEKSWFQRDFGIDLRLIKALSKLGFTYPTVVQAKSIPIALQGKDVLVRARTGSGKTVAFLLPLLHKILTAKSDERESKSNIRAVILAPTKELCKQIEKNALDLIYYCKELISLCSFSDDNNALQQYRLASKPDIVISTPARLVHHMKTGNQSLLDLSQVGTLVIDEADLILSFGYSDDVQAITSRLPKIFQGLLMSATLSPELDKFKRLVLHNPSVIKLQESKGTGHLLQFYLESSEQDKYLILYVFMKLGLLQGKGVIFVNDINKCYRLKLFLQQFFIPAAVLNAELPINSRLHILEEFNRGVFDFLLATDAAVDHGEEQEEGDGDEDDADERLAAEPSEHRIEEEEEGTDGEADGDDSHHQDDDDAESENNVTADVSDGKLTERPREKVAKKRRGQAGIGLHRAESGDRDYGVSRGIDFQHVSFVVNFDFPLTPAAYTHRIGRTARAGASGTSLSFVTDGLRTDGQSDMDVLAAVQAQQAPLNPADNDNVLVALAPIDQTDGGSLVPGGHSANIVQPSLLQFNTRELDNFRYRVEDTLRSVTGVAVKECRTAEIKQEILNSHKLKTYFADNPNDLKILRHDKSVLHPIRQKEHLKHVPDYLVPPSMRSVANTNHLGRRKKRKRAPGKSQEGRKQQSKARDPLQSFESGVPDVGGGADDGQADDGGVPHKAARTSIAPQLEDRVFTNSDSLGHSTAGRQKWKLRHHKGKAGGQAAKRNPLRTPGTFSTMRGKKLSRRPV